MICLPVMPKARCLGRDRIWYCNSDRTKGKAETVENRKTIPIFTGSDNNIMEPTYTHTVKCNDCGEELGDYKPNWGAEHLKKYPDHKTFQVTPKC